MSKLIDLTGKKFYELTVIRKIPPSKDGRTKWECKCSCGNIVIATGYDLKNGKHKSCGKCTKRDYIDLTNMQFGEWTAIKYLGNQTWECRCSCGKISSINGRMLRTGHTKSCGHETTGFKDLTGQQFGEWKAIRYIGDSLWECQCSCGKISNVHSYSLRTGESKSCGHNRTNKSFENLTGQQFNDWTVINYIGDSKWKCKCSCGTIRVVEAYDLKTGKSRNCGHNRTKSYNDLTGRQFGEYKVIKYLTKGTYLCKCSCGTEKEVLGCNLTSGETLSCGCYHRSIYTKQLMERVATEYAELSGDKPFVYDLAKTLNITPYYVSKLMIRYGLRGLLNDKFGSSYEREIYQLLLEIDNDLEIKIRDREQLGGKELDLYIPSNNLAIEFNGTYWHSDKRLDSKYHQNKTFEAGKLGIRIIHIFEYEWVDPLLKLKIISLLRRLVSKQFTIKREARKCDIRHLRLDEEREFLNQYHLQGYTNSSIAYGLFFNTELISVMTFGKPRFSNDYDYELIRYCVKADIEVIGGAEKLFKHFVVENKPNSIVSYCNISKFTGQVYNKLGFKASMSDVTEPNYVWVNSSMTEVLPRYKTQKQKLIDKGYGSYGDTENEIMRNLGYMKIYDCGNIRYSWKRKD